MVKADLGIKIGSKLEVFWNMVKSNCIRDIENAENEIMLSKEMLIVADRRIDEESKK